MVARACSVLLVLLCAVSAVRAQDAEEVLREHGCVACHTVDGASGPAPSFAGLVGRETTVHTAGARRTLVVDDAYLARSIREPDADLVDGYPPGSMPVLGLDDAAVAEVVAALRDLPGAPDPGPETIVPLAISSFLFVFLHLVLSGEPLRSRLVASLGPGRFQGVYSAAVGLAFVGIVVGWIVRPYVPLWTAPPWTRWIPLFIMPLAFFFLIAGYTTKNPAAAGQQNALERPVTGVLTITRHPALWGFALWGLAHLPTNGDLASVFLFGGITTLALAGMLHIDRRRARELGPAWSDFTARTSIVPFVALLRGRTRFDGAGLAWRALVALAVYGAMLHLHEWEFGVSPLPY